MVEIIDAYNEVYLAHVKLTQTTRETMQDTELVELHDIKAIGEARNRRKE